MQIQDIQKATELLESLNNNIKLQQKVLKNILHSMEIYQEFLLTRIKEIRGE